ncbi:hypothetical protein [Pseudomonas urethralis]|uniref:hypothetical protein n=1 Tax=Pseudomonas urethralis TaxID=2740517 RepID=UPI001596B2C0|nr:hypothetical protein [Pseudomonas urethralis]
MIRDAEGLEAAKAAFFARGGVITPVEGYSYQPPPARREFSLSRTPPSISARVVQLMDKGVGIKRIAARLGITQADVHRMAQERR